MKPLKSPPERLPSRTRCRLRPATLSATLLLLLLTMQATSTAAPDVCPGFLSSLHEYSNHRTLRDPISLPVDEAVERRNGSSSTRLPSSNDSQPSPQPPIATFDEWTKEKRKNLSTPPAVPPVVAVAESSSPSTPTEAIVRPAVIFTPSTTAHSQRNYASKECGAKVLLSNPEAENKAAVLNDKERDEYMRNPCEAAAHKFLIVELCETIQATRVELGNLELFSSSPKEFRVSAAERFPSQEWRVLGEFIAADTRNIQTFDLQPAHSYTKFIKLELLSHYGAEHYCTLSVLRVLGISMVEEIEAEAEAAASHFVPATASPAIEVPPLVMETIPEVTMPPVISTQIPPPLVAASQEEPKTEPSREPALQESTKQVKKIVEDVVEVVKSTNIIKTILDKLTNENEKKSSLLSDPNPLRSCRQCPSHGYTKPSKLFCYAFNTIPREPVSARRSFSSTWLRRYDKLRSPHVGLLRQVLTPPVLTTAAPLVQIEPTSHHSTSSDPDNASIVPDATLSAQMPVAGSSTTVPPPIPASRTKEDPLQALPAPAHSHKESIFLKLNKRISLLEVNMTLSTEYLSELSRQYVAQTDDFSKKLDQSRHLTDENLAKVTAHMNRSLASHASQLAILRREVEHLSWWMNGLRGTAALQLRRVEEQKEKAAECGSEDEDEEELDDDALEHRPPVPHFSPHNDGYWTTEQVAYAVIAAQVLTLLTVMALHFFCPRRHAPLTVDEVTLESLIEKRIEELLDKKKLLPVVEDSVAMPVVQKPTKKRKRKRRGAEAGLETASLPSSVPSSPSSLPSRKQSSAMTVDLPELPNMGLNLEQVRTPHGILNFIQVLFSIAALFACCFIWDHTNVYIQFIYAGYGWQTLIDFILFVSFLVELAIFLSHLYGRDVVGTVGKQRMVILYVFVLVWVVISAIFESWYAKLSGQHGYFLHRRFITTCVFNWLLVVTYFLIIPAVIFF